MKAYISMSVFILSYISISNPWRISPIEHSSDLELPILHCKTAGNLWYDLLRIE